MTNSAMLIIWPAAAPLRVRQSLALLWVSWALSLATTVFNLLRLAGPGAGFLIAVAIALLGLQGVLFYFLSKGINAARILLLVLFLFSLRSLVSMAQQVATILPMPEMSATLWLSLSSSALGFGLKAAAVVMLFTGPSSEWFKRKS